MSAAPRASVAALVLAFAPAAALGQDGADAQGKRLYDHYCAQCHGVDGRGDGTAAPRVLPRPRDFTSCKYKIRTTPGGTLPTDADIARSIRNGLPYTSMPAWPGFTDGEVRDLVAHLRSFCADFADPDKQPEPIDIPSPPESTPESVTRGRQVYEEMGCIQCHGQLGRGDGPSAPTMTDDKGDPIRPADLTQRWTFRGGPTARDVFRTFTTGLNGTPMPAYADTIEPADRWHLVHYILSLGDEEPGYDDLVIAHSVERPVERAALEAPAEDAGDEAVEGASDTEAAAPDAGDLFAGAPVARIALVGQIMQPGRDFHPPTTSVEVQAVHDNKYLAIRLRWHDRRADTSGTNAPDVEVPRFEEPAPAGSETGGEEDFWGVGTAEPEQPSGGGDDFWGVESGNDSGGGGDDFWGEASGGGGSAWSDAVAIQLPKTPPSGIVKPYFLFGDKQNPVDLWFVDLATGVPRLYTGSGSDSLEARVAEDVEVVTGYDRGEWTVTFLRPLREADGLSFDTGQYVPIAFTVWNGMAEERGNRRALSVWHSLYVEPAERPSAVGPMIRIALLVLVAELAAIVLIRRRYRRPRPDEPERGETLLPSARELAG